MDAIEFVNKYEVYFSEIEMVIKPEYKSILEVIKTTDPHDLVRPESWIPNEMNARGFVWSYFLQEIKKKETN